LVEKLAADAPWLGKLDCLSTDNIGPELAEDWCTPDATSDTFAMLQYTSGSTASPKGVMVTHSNLLLTLEDMDRGWKHSAHRLSTIPSYFFWRASAATSSIVKAAQQTQKIATSTFTCVVLYSGLATLLLFLASYAVIDLPSYCQDRTFRIRDGLKNTRCSCFHSEMRSSQNAQDQQID